MRASPGRLACTEWTSAVYGSGLRDDPDRPASGKERRPSMHSAAVTEDRTTRTIAPLSKSARRIRVLHVIHSMNIGGMERVLADLIRVTDRSRFDMHVLCLEKLGPIAERAAAHATIHRAVPLPRWSLIWPGTLAAQIREIGPDVVHTHGQIWCKASLAARMAGVPRIVHTDHGRPPGPEPLSLRVLERRAARRVDVVVAVSQSLADQLQNGYAAASKLCVVINGVDTDAHVPRRDDGSVHAELGVTPETALIGSVVMARSSQEPSAELPPLAITMDEDIIVVVEEHRETIGV